MYANARRHPIAFSIGFLTLVTTGLAVVLRIPADAHGSVASPPSRVYSCRFLEPNNPQCRKAWQANSQALYDWMEVNLPNAAGRHRELIPDGRLCSAGRDKYRAFDEPSSEWPLTHLTPGPSGLYHLEFTATAPHATQYYRWYLTRDGYDPSRPLRWDDLELVHDSGPRAGESHYHADVRLPDRRGRHVLYLVWQRSDSPEAFYSCSDVTMESTPSTTVTTRPPSSTTATTVPPSTTRPAPTSTIPQHGGFGLKLQTTTSWETGHCAQGTVTNTGTRAGAWIVRFTLDGGFTSFWDGRSQRTGRSVTVRGETWNSWLSPGRSTTFGYCATGPPPG